MANTTRKPKSSINFKRSTVDKVVSSLGLILAVGLIFLSGALFWAHNFIHSQVVEQLSAQKIKFPAADSPAFKALNEEDQEAIRPFAGQSLTTGAGAAAFANHYIGAHLEKSGGGKTYSELSEESRANPDSAELKAKVETMFKGETLRGVLLNAYAFDTMAVVARIIAVAAVIAAAILLLLVAFGFRHAKRAK